MAPCQNERRFPRIRVVCIKHAVLEETLVVDERRILGQVERPIAQTRICLEHFACRNWPVWVVGECCLPREETSVPITGYFSGIDLMAKISVDQK